MKIALLFTVLPVYPLTDDSSLDWSFSPKGPSISGVDVATCVSIPNRGPCPRFQSGWRSGCHRHQHEEGIEGNSRWESGDWNGDMESGTGDLVTAFQAGGNEADPRPAMAAVPGRGGLLLLSVSGMLLLARRR